MEIGNTEKNIYAGFENFRWITNQLASEWIQLTRDLCALCHFITRESCVLRLECCNLCRQDVSVWIRVNSNLKMYS